MRFCFLLGVAMAVVAAPAQSLLVWSTGNSSGNTFAVSQYLLATGEFTSVTPVNDSLMTFSIMNQYDKVLYFSNDAGVQDPAVRGNMLGQYADTGKRLVIATFSLANQGGNTLQGSIRNKMALDVGGSSLYTPVTVGATDGNSLWAGVGGVSGYFHDDVDLVRGTLHGSWSDGTPLIASHNNVVNVNLFPDASFGNVGGDFDRLFANALVAPVPEPASLLAIGLGVAALARRRRYRG